MDAPIENDLVRQMRRVPLFVGLDDHGLQTVFARAARVDVSPGAVLAREGDEERSFWALLDGELTVSVALDDDSGTIDVSTIQPGGCFGEMAALLGGGRTATVTAARASRLLRLDDAALRELFDTCPGFGWAFSAQLARSLKSALAEKNELQAEAHPETVVLDVPALDRLREYMASYYTTALRTLLRQHRLVVDREFPHYEAPLRLSADDRARWHTLFGVPADTLQPPPFTFHTTVGTLVLMKVVADVGVNFRNLLHMRSVMDLAPRAVEPGVEHRLRARLADILVLRDDRVLLVVDSRLDDAAGRMVRGFRDYFVILALEPQQVDALRASKGFGHLPLPDLRDTVRRRSKLSGRVDVRRTAVDIPSDMGMRYGKVSGDLNLVHTTPLAAKLFGHPRPFVQGLCTANFVLATVTAEAPTPLQQFAIAFTQPVFTGDRIEILTGAGEFEVVDAETKVLAFGSFTRQVAHAGT